METLRESLRKESAPIIRHLVLTLLFIGADMAIQAAIRLSYAHLDLSCTSGPVGRGGPQIRAGGHDSVFPSRLRGGNHDSWTGGRLSPRNQRLRLGETCGTTHSRRRKRDGSESWRGREAMSQRQVLSWRSLLGLYTVVAVVTGVLGVVLVGLGANDMLTLAIVGSFVGVVAVLHVTAPQDSPASLWAQAKASVSLTRLSAFDWVLLAGAMVLAVVWAFLRYGQRGDQSVGWGTIETALSQQRVLDTRSWLLSWSLRCGSFSEATSFPVGVIDRATPARAGCTSGLFVYAMWLFIIAQRDKRGVP